MSTTHLEDRHDRLQVHAAAGFCVGVTAQIVEEILVLAEVPGPGDDIAIFVALAGWLWVAATFFRMQALSKRSDGTWLDTITRDERTAVSRAKALETGFGACLITAFAGSIASTFVEGLTVDFVGMSVIGVGLAAASVRFVLANR